MDGSTGSPTEKNTRGEKGSTKGVGGRVDLYTLYEDTERVLDTTSIWVGGYEYYDWYSSK